MTGHATAAAEQLLAAAIERRVFPGAVAEVGSTDGVGWRCVLGTLTFGPELALTRLETLFDLASLTKAIATTSVALRLDGAHALPLGTQVADVVREWTGGDRAPATVRHLLEHASGLSARLLDRPPNDRRTFMHEICTMPLEYEPGSRAIYSDLGFILLGFCCEMRGDGSLANQAQALLDLVADDDTRHRLLTSVDAGDRPRAAPTSPLAEDDRRGRTLVGEVHDNYAAALGGFAGHAGLFGTAPGVGRFARLLLRAARGLDATPLPFSPAVVQRAITKSSVPNSSRALGWDTMLPTSSCGSRMSNAAFGHTGFTGTSLWVDPALDRYFVLLTNRVCGGGTSDDMQQVRRAFHDALADA
jgi:CubicO group peptidase (beta-lactamase class C family)